MTSEHSPRYSPPPPERRIEQSDLPRETEVERARAELVSALQEFEDKINVRKRIRRMRAEEPGKLYSALGVAGAAAAGLLSLVVVAARRRH